ncbi:PP2C family protein-serine/threonine phosphatase [Streptomyces nanshensis]|uniref:PP2C family protein-serine/threonine phosphatase n=1 Tax=Streptomyces nanshensis TaxID=518642 RepID=UPI001FD1384E|nr:PP2C family protein-serine/threonine phosphatase [Streptomyces nanshensis]
MRTTVGFAVPAVWVVGVLAWELLLPVSTHCVALLAATPALACAGTGARTGVWLGGGCALFALYPLGTVPVYEEFAGKSGMFAAILCVAVASCYALRRRARLADELARTREVATAAQQALIPPLPPHLGGLTVAAGYLSASPGAAVGGDLYDAVATAYGVRVVIGDVRGHGLGAIGTVAAVLGGFREAAYDEARLERVPHRLERTLERHLAAGRGTAAGPQDPVVDEEFVTVLLLEVRPDGAVRAVNCGHPWPYRLAAGQSGRRRPEPVSTAEPLPPLGLTPLPPEVPAPATLRLPPGEALFLYTDGAEDARDADGGFFPLGEALTSALSVRGRRRDRRTARAGAVAVAHPEDVVESVRRSLLRHACGRLPDDVALLALRNDRCRVHGPAHERPEHGPPPEDTEGPGAGRGGGPAGEPDGEQAGADGPLACSCP